MHVKTVVVRNPKNVLVQIPIFIVENWGLTEGSLLEMHAKDGYIQILPKGRPANESSERLAKQPS